MGGVPIATCESKVGVVVVVSVVSIMIVVVVVVRSIRSIRPSCRRGMSS